jgi:hypothetical protein
LSIYFLNFITRLTDVQQAAGVAYSQMDSLILKQKGEKIGKKNKKAHEVTENIPVESSSGDDGV